VFICVHLWLAMARFDQVEGFILTGGSSVRMGRDKALLEIGGVPLAVRAAQMMAPLVGRVTLIGPPERYGALGLHVAPDDEPGQGPLGGIATALRVTECDWNLVVGCDMPYLIAEWLKFLIGEALTAPADAVIPQSAHGRDEPLCAMYHRRCGPAMRVELGLGIRKVTTGLAALLVAKLPYERWKQFDSRGRLFKNMNTPEDYAEARGELATDEHG
jgi:molybdopterin-guanine dinucleotide biosynthesis protein A